ncbi:MAG: hypothetical protein M3040_05420 [Bacteroidota bacterium]|nr:hypothetical protein [Bacteroidota bacterium]
MSLLKHLLTPFVEFDEEKKVQQAKENNPVASPIHPAPATTTAAPVTTAPAIDQNAHHPLITGSVNNAPGAAQIPTYSPAGTISKPLPEHQQYFEKLIDEANEKNPLFQGVDFKEFINSKLDIQDIQDEALRYKTAFNVLKSTGLTKEKLLSTGQEYLNIIGRDLNAFQGAQNLQYQKEVRQKELLIQKKAEELQALTQRLNALKAEINQLTNEIDITKERLNTAKNSFLLAGENKQNEIQTELEKINQYF